ncbi:hypothetical protein ACHAWF_012359 [Thalassiosira exigua]
MRIGAAAVALVVSLAAASPSAAAERGGDPNSVVRSPLSSLPTIPPSPWGLAPRGGGAGGGNDESRPRSLSPSSTSSSSSSSSVGDGGSASGDDDARAPAPGLLRSSSSRILSSVSAGGGSPEDADAGRGAAAARPFAPAAAFVGASSSSSSKPSAAGAVASARAARSSSRPPESSSSRPASAATATASTSSSSLSVATNTNTNQRADSDVDPRAVGAVEEEDAPADPAAAKTTGPARGRGPLRILFLSSDTGGGHRASAEALADAFQRQFPGTTHDLFDIWTDVETNWPYNSIKETYKSFSASPWKWRALYHMSNLAWYAKFADLHSYYMNEELIRQGMEKYDPDVVVSVHPTMNYVPLHSIRRIAKERNKDIPFFTVVTDFGSGHCTWFNKDVDKMYLASDPIKNTAQEHGSVPDEKIVMSGLPIRHDFAAQADAMGDRTSEQGKLYQAKVRESIGIDPNKRMVLVMGGGEGVGSLSDIVNELYVKLTSQGVDATICVVCGRNEELKANLETRCWDTVVSQSLQSYESLKSRFFNKVLSIHAHRSRRIQLALDKAAAKAADGNDVAEVPGEVDVVPLGFVVNMAEYMVAADVLVSKAGPGTIAEAAAVGLPVMVTSHLPGQEAGNVDIVLEGGFGDFCEDAGAIALEVACWLGEPQLLESMSERARQVGHPHAAEEIALDIGEMTLRWMERNEQRQHKTP